MGNVTSGLAPYTGAWTEWEAAHLLRRVSFWCKKTDLDTLLAMTLSDAVDALMNFGAPTLPSATAFNNYQTRLPDSGGIAYGASWTSNNLTTPTPMMETIMHSGKAASTAGTGACVLNDATSIREKMVQFWYHFIPVNFDDVRVQERNSATTCNDYMSLLRSNALGNFKSLIKAIAKSPAMLVYLGNQYSTAAIPNENFARELMELFTMGKVPTQNYTEDDIKAASYVLSGWRVANFGAAYPLSSAFNASFHNQTNKVFSGFWQHNHQ